MEWSEIKGKSGRNKVPSKKRPSNGDVVIVEGLGRGDRSMDNKGSYLGGGKGYE